jgi:hypothetical protein
MDAQAPDAAFLREFEDMLATVDFKESPARDELNASPTDRRR